MLLSVFMALALKSAPRADALWPQLRTLFPVVSLVAATLLVLLIVFQSLGAPECRSASVKGTGHVTAGHEALSPFAVQHARASALFSSRSQVTLTRWPSLRALLDAAAAFADAALQGDAARPETPRAPLTAVVVVYNEPWLLVPSLLSVAPFVSELVVADHGSDDGVTAPLLQALAGVFARRLGPAFLKLVSVNRDLFDQGHARNIANTHVTQPLVLKWDSDLVAFDSFRGDPAGRCFRRVFIPWVDELLSKPADYFYYNLLNYRHDLNHSYTDPIHQFSRECFVARTELSYFVPYDGFRDYQRFAAPLGKTAAVMLDRHSPKHPACAVHLKGVKPAEAMFTRAIRHTWWKALVAEQLTESQLPLEAWLARRDGNNLTLAARVAVARAQALRALNGTLLPVAEVLTDKVPYTGPPALLMSYVSTLSIPLVAYEDWF